MSGDPGYSQEDIDDMTAMYAAHSTEVETARQRVFGDIARGIAAMTTLPLQDVSACVARYIAGYDALKRSGGALQRPREFNTDENIFKVGVVVYQGCVTPVDTQALLKSIHKLCEELSEQSVFVCARDQRVLCWAQTICVVEFTATDCTLRTWGLVTDTRVSVEMFVNGLNFIDKHEIWTPAQLAAWAAEERSKPVTFTNGIHVPCTVMPYDCSDAIAVKILVVFIKGLEVGQHPGGERRIERFNTLMVYQIKSPIFETYLIHLLPGQQAVATSLHAVQRTQCMYIDNFCNEMRGVFGFRGTGHSPPLNLNMDDIIFKLASHLSDCVVSGRSSPFTWPHEFTLLLHNRGEDAARFTLAVANYTNPSETWTLARSSPWIYKATHRNYRFLVLLSVSAFRIVTLNSYSIGLGDIGNDTDIAALDIGDRRRGAGLGDATALRSTMTRLLSVLGLFADHKAHSLF
jgi:hypothetical protein